ncbi:MAG: glutamine amidotransferase-related protein [Bacteroidota bacterium]|jgi:GMP synthase (glutamine-hydrolysing)
MFLIIQFGSKKTPAIRDCLLSCAENTEIQSWDSQIVKPNNLKGIVFSGSPTFFTEVDHSPYFEKISPLLNWDVPILGICFGHQLLGILHGAKIFRGEEVRRVETIKILKNDELFDGFDQQFEMTEDHTEGIDVPSDFIHLASSGTYFNEAMKHKEKNFWGVQFHPEVSGEQGMKLFRNFISICNRKNLRE